jgi:hypothetical protein
MRRAKIALAMLAILVAAWVLIGERHQKKVDGPVPWRVAP